MVQGGVRTMTVVVREVLGEDLLEMTTSEDEEPVQTLSADGTHEALREGVRTRCSSWGLDDLIPSVRNTSSKLAVNFVSRSRIRNRIARELGQDELRLRACWVAHAPAGLAVTPEKWTRRLSSSMKNST